MKKIALLIVIGCAGMAKAADPQSSVSVSRGSYVIPASVNGSSVAGTAFISADGKRQDAMVTNNTSSTIWIGTVAATQSMIQHDNISNGTPLLSSAAFSLNGSMTDALYFTCGVGVATCNVRVLDGKTR